MRTSLSGNCAKYKYLVQLLSREPRYVKVLASVCKPSEHERLSHAVFGITQSTGGTLGIIRELLALEFSQKLQQPSTILRVNSLVSKVMGMFSRKHGTGFLKTVLEPVVCECFKASLASVELDKLSLSSEALSEEILSTKVQSLERLCQMCLNRITSTEMVREMPRELRAVAYYIWRCCMEHNLDAYPNCSSSSLVGGYIMLRFFGPALALPQSSAILATDAMVTPENRRVLVLVCKVLQKVSNGEFFEESELFLNLMNLFITRSIGSLQQYFAEICRDPLAAASDISIPFADIDVPVSFEFLNSMEFEMEDLLFLHKILDRYSAEIVSRLSSVGDADGWRTKSMSLLAADAEFLQVIIELGSPIGPSESPVGSPEQSGRGRAASLSKESRVAHGRSGSSASRTDMLLDLNLSRMVSRYDRSDAFTAFEKALFMYLGRHRAREDAFPSSDGSAARPPVVLYVIMSRLVEGVLADIDMLIVYVVRTLRAQLLDGSSGAGDGFIVIFDFSFAEQFLSDAIAVLMHKFLMGCRRVFGPRHLERLKGYYLVHLTDSCRTLMDSLFVSLDDEFISRYVHVLEDWRLLLSVLPLEHVELPLESKRWTAFVAGCRISSIADSVIVMVGYRSVLYFDVSCKVLLGELVFAEVDQILPDMESGHELHFLLVHHSAIDQTRISFVFNSTFDREQFSMLCYERCLMSDVLGRKQLIFDVVKTNRRGRKQARCFMLLADGLLNTKSGKQVQKFVPYSWIRDATTVAGTVGGDSVSCEIHLRPSHVNVSSQEMDQDREAAAEKSWLLEIKDSGPVFVQSLTDCMAQHARELRSSISKARVSQMERVALDRFFSGLTPSNMPLRRYSSFRKEHMAIPVKSSLQEWDFRRSIRIGLSLLRQERDGGAESTGTLTLSAPDVQRLCVLSGIELASDDLENIMSQLDPANTGQLLEEDIFAYFVQAHLTGSPVTRDWKVQNSPPD